MNIFILNSGRCGSTTFIKACSHIINYSSAHESRTEFLGENRFQYPENHIEADNRLSWFLGRLEKSYGNTAMYVHLKRDINKTAQSFTKRYSSGIIRAYRESIIMGMPYDVDPINVSLDYLDTVNSNIELFLRDKTKVMIFSLENSKEDFKKFWDMIGARGDLESSLSEFNVNYNASARLEKKSITKKVMKKWKKITRKLCYRT
jgi:hypothetical protein